MTIAVANYNPSLGSTVLRNTPIAFDVTGIPTDADIIVTAYYSDATAGLEEVVYKNGVFSPYFSLNSRFTVTDANDLHFFNVLRDGGWPSTILRFEAVQTPSSGTVTGSAPITVDGSNNIAITPSSSAGSGTTGSMSGAQAIALATATSNIATNTSNIATNTTSIGTLNTEVTALQTTGGPSITSPDGASAQATANNAGTLTFGSVSTKYLTAAMVAAFTWIWANVSSVAISIAQVASAGIGAAMSIYAGKGNANKGGALTIGGGPGATAGTNLAGDTIIDTGATVSNVGSYLKLASTPGNIYAGFQQSASDTFHIQAVLAKMLLDVPASGVFEFAANGTIYEKISPAAAYTVVYQNAITTLADTWLAPSSGASGLRTFRGQDAVAGQDGGDLMIGGGIGGDASHRGGNTIVAVGLIGPSGDSNAFKVTCLTSTELISVKYNATFASAMWESNGGLPVYVLAASGLTLDGVGAIKLNNNGTNYATLTPAANTVLQLAGSGTSLQVGGGTAPANAAGAPTGLVGQTGGTVSSGSNKNGGGVQVVVGSEGTGGTAGTGIHGSFEVTFGGGTGDALQASEVVNGVTLVMVGGNRSAVATATEWPTTVSGEVGIANAGGAISVTSSVATATNHPTNSVRFNAFGGHLRAQNSAGIIAELVCTSNTNLTQVSPVSYCTIDDTNTVTSIGAITTVTPVHELTATNYAAASNGAKVTTEYRVSLWANNATLGCVKVVATWVFASGAWSATGVELLTNSAGGTATSTPLGAATFSQTISGGLLILNVSVATSTGFCSVRCEGEGFQ